MNARAEKRPALVSIIEAGRYRGCILSRGVQGYESYDSCERSIGVFESAELARDAVLRGRIA
jgi:hypothetical protein